MQKIALSSVSVCLVLSMLGCGSDPAAPTAADAQAFKGTPTGARSKDVQDSLAAQREKFMKLHPPTTGGGPGGPPPGVQGGPTTAPAANK